MITIEIDTFEDDGDSGWVVSDSGDEYDPVYFYEGEGATAQEAMDEAEDRATVYEDDGLEITIVRRG